MAVREFGKTKFESLLFLKLVCLFGNVFGGKSSSYEYIGNCKTQTQKKKKKTLFFPVLSSRHYAYFTVQITNLPPSFCFITAHVN